MNQAMKNVDVEPKSPLDADSLQQTRLPWESFVNAKTSHALFSAWLALLCDQVSEVAHAAILVESQDTKTFVPVAVWPEASPHMSRLAKVIESSLKERRAITQNLNHLSEEASSSKSSRLCTQIAYPMILGEKIVAVIAIEFKSVKKDVPTVFRHIYWGSAWLSTMFADNELRQAAANGEQTGSVLEVLSIALRRGKLQQTLFEMVNELRQKLSCSKVACGLVKQSKIKLAALSEAATFEKHTALSKAYVRAMEEAYDTGKAINCDTSANTQTVPMHKELALLSGAAFIITCPLHDGAEIIGLLTLERTTTPFTEAEISWLEAFAAMLAPVMTQRIEAQKNSVLKLRDEWQALLRKLFGPNYLIWKAASLLLLITFLTLTLVHVDYRVTAKTVIEGEVQRVISAPFEGFVKAGYVRAGDTVKIGQPLAKLDERDLLIEQARWSSERDQYENRLREAMAEHDLVSVQVLSSQLNQAEAELGLVNKKIAYSNLTAPFDGIVVTGDLSQQIGSPVEVGKELFVIAPLKSYRVILQVDEREIRHIRVGQHGQLVITGLAGDSIPLKIQNVTSVATSEEGKNYFRVEADLLEASHRLRPGMEGVGKVETGNQSLWWIMMHGFTDWLRITLWNWLP